MKAVVRTLILLCAIVWTLPAAAQTQCAQFELVGRGARVDYQPFEPSPTIDTFDLRVRRLSDGISGVRFLLVDETPAPSGPQIGPTGPVNYDIAWLDDTTRRILVVGNEQPQPMSGAQISFPGRSGVEITRFRFTVPSGQQASAQKHSEHLSIRYQCLGARGEVIGATQEQPAGIELEVTVPKYAAAYVGSIGQTRGTISFGEVSGPAANLVKAIGITALSTMPYAVKVESENAGLLKRRHADDSGILYAMRYGNALVADGDTIVCPTTPAPMGSPELFEVSLDRMSISQQPAGDYSDTVTLTFTPRDVAAVSTCAVTR